MTDIWDDFYTAFSRMLVWAPTRYVTLRLRDQRRAASLRYRNRAEITVLMCDQKPYPACFSVFAPAQKLSG